GCVETLFGRRRWFSFQSASLRALAGRDPHDQGTAADLIKRAMVAVAAQLQRNKHQSRILLTVHDELVVEVAPGEEDDVKEVVVQEMTRAHGGLMEVPLNVDVACGPTWT
ncbi:DNA polymerase I, partial [Haematococcus lacustris]